MPSVEGVDDNVPPKGYGVYGYSQSDYGVRGRSNTGYGMHAQSANNYGMIGFSSTSYGVLGYSEKIYGVYAASASGLAAYLSGHVRIIGNLEKAGGSFKIDHPLDPANKYLCHSFVESPDMKNVYDGVVVLDNKGKA
jgi:hypothetical protein